MKSYSRPTYILSPVGQTRDQPHLNGWRMNRSRLTRITTSVGSPPTSRSTWTWRTQSLKNLSQKDESPETSLRDGTQIHDYLTLYSRPEKGRESYSFTRYTVTKERFLLTVLFTHYVEKVLNKTHTHVVLGSKCVPPPPDQMCTSTTYVNLFTYERWFVKPVTSTEYLIYPPFIYLDR